MEVSATLHDSGVAERLERLSVWANDMQPVLKELAEYSMQAHRQRFVEMKDPEGKPWVALSPAYRARKPVNKDKILTLYGDLRGSLQYEVASNKVRLGVTPVYANVHQWGWVNKNIPARPYMGFNQQDEAAILQIIKQSLERII